MLTESEPKCFLRRLGDAQANRTLALAIRENASVLIEPAGDASSPVLIGNILSGDDNDLLLILNPDDRVQHEALCETEWEVRLLLGEQTYSFPTPILETDHTGPSLAARIPRPRTLFADVRRKTQRFRLAESSSVELSWIDQGRFFFVSGQLCNVSADGLAFLTDSSAADQLAAASSLTAQFDLPGCPERFRLPASVRAVTPAGTPACNIVHMQFQRRTSGQTEHLLTALEQFLQNRIQKRPLWEQST